MNKELTPLGALAVIYNSQDIMGGYDNFWKSFRVIEKSVKALEIIKGARINGLKLVWYDEMWFVYAPYCEKPIMYGNKKEDYNLLKEVFE